MSTLFARNRNKITDLSLPKADASRVVTFDSINKAKIASVALQLLNGGLGRGSVVAS